jgi:hypothetical protein
MRFKPPPANSEIGWRVEFRPCELQVSMLRTFSSLLVSILQNMFSPEKHFLPSLTVLRAGECLILLALSQFISDPNNNHN